SRFHHGLTLAQAYALTRERQWLDAWCSQVESWLNENPVEFGINWVSPMDVAIRAVNWIAALELVGDGISDARLAARIVESLMWHGRVVAANLEIHRGLTTTIANNHLLANIVGLAVIGAWFSDCDEGQRWLATSSALLSAEIERQFYPDGMAFEA